MCNDSAFSGFSDLTICCEPPLEARLAVLRRAANRVFLVLLSTRKLQLHVKNCGSRSWRR